MNILAVDDERMALEDLVQEINEAIPGNMIYSFNKPKDALNFIRNTSCEVAFLDIQMCGMTGIELAKMLKNIVPDINIIFTTGFLDYGIDAIGVRASGYLMKPVIAEDIKQEMENLRNPVSSLNKKRIRVQTFGNFEIFCEEIPVKFQRSKSKEIIAYLVDIRGTSATNAEVAAILWEDGIYDRNRQKQLSNYVHDIKSTLKSVKADEMFFSDRKTLRINPKLFDCDYYSFLEGDMVAINSYTGKYMNAYSWAELTVAYLSNQI